MDEGYSENMYYGSFWHFDGRKELPSAVGTPGMRRLHLADAGHEPMVHSISRIPVRRLLRRGQGPQCAPVRLEPDQHGRSASHRAGGSCLRDYTDFVNNYWPIQVPAERRKDYCLKIEWAHRGRLENQQRSWVLAGTKHFSGYSRAQWTSQANHGR